jgi:hypothetical protein
MSDLSPLSVRTMSSEEVRNIAVEWALAEGWNPGLYDVDAFYAADRDGFFAGFLNDQPIACISVVKYNANFAFLGFYIVKKEFRGLGYGISIWDKAIASAGNRNIGLDGVLEQQLNYEKSGFTFEYSNIRFEGKALHRKVNNNLVVPVSSVPFSELSGYDRQCFPATRDTFLREWISLPESAAFAFVENQKIKGYTVIRKCRTGYKIAPLFADSMQIAQQLFQSACNFIVEDSIIYLDVPEVNNEALTMAKSNHMKEVFRTARMYTEKAPDINTDKIFGVTSFELG